MTEKPHNFWEELKRRKVIRVIIGYAAAAYVLLELTSIIAEPLGLPDWTINFVLILLCIGFVITVVVSWIYDFTSKGIEKTKPAKVTWEQETITYQPKRKLKVSDIIISVLFVAVIILVYPKIFKKNKLEQLRSGEEITVAVMPFENLTNDTTWNVWQKGIQNQLISTLTNSEELEVRQFGSVGDVIQGEGITNYASLTPSITREISEKLNANVFITGSIVQTGESIRISAQLYDTKTKETYRSFQIDGIEEEILNITDSLSAQINNYLIISVLDKELKQNIRHFSFTSSPEAYRKYILGQNAFRIGDYATARDYYLDAIKIDSNFTAATVALMWGYNNNEIYDQAKKWCLKLYAIRNQMTRHDEARTNFIYAWLFETPREAIMATRQCLEIDDQDPSLYRSLGQSYSRLFEYEKAIPQYERALDIYKKWGSKPDYSVYYLLLGHAFHNTGQYRKERKLYRIAERDFPDDYFLLYSQAILALSEGKTKAANEYIEKFISICKEWSESEVDIANYLAYLYQDAELIDEAEEYFREALKLAPESPRMMNSLAWFLIDTERNIEEGLTLIEKALEFNPDFYDNLDIKGWGLYKQGKYQEAYDILLKSWDLRMENAVYDHEAFLRLEEAKKAVADQENQN